MGDARAWRTARAREDMSTVEITPETQKHPLAVMLMLGCKAAPIVAYVAMRRARDDDDDDDYDER